MSHKEDFEKLRGMISSVRIQYILDKYLKKIKLPKYRDLDINEEDFKEILNLGYFTSGDLAQYYIIRKGKIPTALDKKFEQLVYTHKGKEPITKKRKTGETLVIRSKSQIVDFDDKKDVDRYFAELIKQEEKGMKKISKDLIAQGYAQPSNIKRKRVFDVIKNKIKREIDNIWKDFDKDDEDFEQEKRTVPIFVRERDAENYNNPIYQENKDKFFRRGVEMGKTKSERNSISEKFKMLSVKDKKQKPVSKEDFEKIRKLVKAMTIKEEDIKKMGQIKRKRSIASSASSSRKSSIASPTSSKSDKSVAGYDSE